MKRNTLIAAQRSIALALTLGLTLTSCGGGSGGGGTPSNPPSSLYYFQISVNGGAPIKLNSSWASAAGGLSDLWKFSAGGALPEAKDNLPGFHFEIWREEQTIQAGRTYNNINSNVHAVYNLTGFDLYTPDSDLKDLNISIDSLTDKETKGRFSGTLKRNTNGEIMKITGEFYVPVHSN